MADYPSLSQNPEWPLRETREDQTIRSSMEAGYVKTRRRYTRDRRTWRIVYQHMSNDDKETLETFFDDTVGGGADSFNWTHPTTEDTHVVRFKKPPDFINVVLTYWNVEFELEEV